MKKVLITGSCGFIFGNFIRKAIYDQNQKKPQDRLYTFTSIDRVTANAINSMYWNKNHVFHVADLRDAHVIDVIFQFEKPDIVIHGAAETFVDTSLKDPNSFVTSNVLGTQVIINACVKHRAEKLIYVSCYDAQTKAVTKSGLKTYDQLVVGDLVLSINPKTGVVEEKEIEKIIVQDYDGDMCLFNSNRIDALTTPNHRFLYHKNNSIHWTTAEELNNISGKKYFPNGKVLRVHNNSICVPYVGEVDSNAFFYVCGAFIGDGFTAYQDKKNKNISGFKRKEFLKKCRNPKTGRFFSTSEKGDERHTICHSYRIFFDIPENDKCRKKLENALTKLNITWYAEKNKSGEHIYFTSKKWMDLFDQMGRYANNKHILEWMFDYSYENLYNLLMGIHDSDGHGWEIKGRNKSVTTVSLKLRDQLCYLGSMLGFFTRFNKKTVSEKSPVIDGREINQNYDAWIIYFSTKRAPLFPKYFITKYDGKVWCLKVKDNQNFLVGRNGKTYFSGNTDEVYGQLTSEGDPAWTEESPIAPRNPYSASKAAGELMVQAAHQTHGLIYNITRSSNCYGPRQLPEKLIPKAIKCIIEGQKIPIYGQGLQIRDWTYVADNCSALMAILDKGVPNQIYNISANQEFTNVETIQSVCNAMGKGHSLMDFIPDPRGGHDFRYSVNTTKIKELGWKPSYKFKDGIKDTVQWYLDNQWFLK